jgi:hypothetical protein
MPCPTIPSPASRSASARGSRGQRPRATITSNAAAQAGITR